MDEKFKKEILKKKKRQISTISKCLKTDHIVANLYTISKISRFVFLDY